MSVQELGSQAYQKALFGDFSGAVQILDKAIMKYPKDEKLLNNRSFCLLKMRDCKRALEDSDKMVELFPKYTKSYFRKAEVLVAMKRFIEAEQVLNQLLQIDPNCAEATQLLYHVKSQCRVSRVMNLSSTDNSGTKRFTSSTPNSSDDLYFSDEDLDKMLELAISLTSTASKNKKSKKKKKK